MPSEHDKRVLDAMFNPLFAEMQWQSDGTASNEQDVSATVRAEQSEGIRLAERGQLEEAEQLFSRVITQSDHIASLYNDRAQIRRMRRNLQGALEDATRAIELSKGTGKAGCQALCQRGLIYRLSGENELARGDFCRAADQGCTFAKQQLVAMDPYAALCNRMLRQMFHRLTNPQTTA